MPKEVDWVAKRKRFSMQTTAIASPPCGQLDVEISAVLLDALPQKLRAVLGQNPVTIYSQSRSVRIGFRDIAALKAVMDEKELISTLRSYGFRPSAYLIPIGPSA